MVLGILQDSDGEMQPIVWSACDKGVNDEAIWRKHSGELVRFAAVIVGPSDAEDLLSAVVLRILNAKGSLEALEDPRPYLFLSLIHI